MDKEELRRQALIALARKRAAEMQALAPKSLGQKIKENLIGDDDPTTHNTGEKVGAMLNKAGEALTFGLIGDEADAALRTGGGAWGDYDKALETERQKEAVLERDNPGLALTADVGGSLAGAVLPGGALARGAGLIKRMGTSAAVGAAGAGTYGAMEGEGLEDRIQQGKSGLALGAGVGAAVPIAGAGVQKVADSVVQRRAIKDLVKNAPSTEELKRQGQKLYQEVDDAGVHIRSDRTRDLMDEITQLLQSEGAGFTGADKVLPSSHAVMRAAKDVGAKSNTVPMQELDMFRRYMGHAAGANLANKGDTRATTQAMTKLDDFVKNLGPSDVDTGDIAALQKALPKAREVWSRMSKSQMLDDAVDNAADYRTGEASGLRAQFQRIVKNPKLSRGFTDAEIKAMRRVVNGTLPEQVLNYLGSGLGMMGQMAGGAVVGGLPGALMGTVTAAGARKGSEAMVRKNAEIARSLVASGGSQNLPVASDRARAIIEALMRRTAAAVPQ